MRRAARPSPAEGQGAGVPQAIAGDDADPAGEEPFDGDRHGRFEPVPGPARDRGIEVARENAEPADRARLTESILLFRKPVAADHIVLHRLALALRQLVGIFLQAVYRGAFGEALRRRLIVEITHDPRQFVERAAEPLTILLREFGKLRGERADEKAEDEGEAAEKREHLGLTRRGHHEFRATVRKWA